MGREDGDVSGVFLGGTNAVVWVWGIFCLLV
jgi:hypothetical protein